MPKFTLKKTKFRIKFTEKKKLTKRLPFFFETSNIIQRKHPIPIYGEYINYVGGVGGEGGRSREFYKFFKKYFVAQRIIGLIIS